jgi:hypothetical protein
LNQCAHVRASETFLAFVAGRTQNIGIGHGVVCLPPMTSGWQRGGVIGSRRRVARAVAAVGAPVLEFLPIPHSKDVSLSPRWSNIGA